jgi:hypothetical protein
MNEQLPPIDPSIREHLTRRSSGRLPDGLVVDILTALDSAPDRRSIWPVPRLAVVGLSLAIVAVLVATIAFSASRPGPAATTPSLNGYPGERALTTAELSALMAGPALPVNTALVASVTIDVRTDVCPMNRYQTQGVVEGMRSQVCVMTSDVAVQPFTLTGTFAFRYLAPGYLGLLGQITLASSSTLAFKVVNDWPLAGKTFLVDGWFYGTDLSKTLFSAGGVPLACPLNTPRPVGDPLNPNGQLMCEIDWLSDDANVEPSTLPDGSHVAPTHSRLVEAAGMATIDSVATGTPVHGVFVVRGMTAPCPNASQQDPFGCWSGLVLAKLANITVPEPNSSSLPATPTPTLGLPATPIVEPSGTLASAAAGLLGPGNRPLTEAEFSALWAADRAHLAGRVAIVEGPVPTGFECSTMLPPCEVTILDGLRTHEGNWVVRVGTYGQLDVMGEISISYPQNTFVFKLGDAITAWNNQTQSGLMIVDAWLDWENGCDAPTDPSYGTAGCSSSLLTAENLNWMHMRSLLPPNAVVAWVQADAYRQFGSSDLGSGAVHGLYLVSVISGAAPTILARLEPATP